MRWKITNPKLLNSLLKSFTDEKIKLLIDYALGRVSEHEDQRILNKICFNANEILTSETELISEYFFKTPDSKNI